VKQRLRRAWALDDHGRALDQLRALAGELDRSYPGAAGSLRRTVTLCASRSGMYCVNACLFSPARCAMIRCGSPRE
jgi:hypothetical protein